VGPQADGLPSRSGRRTARDFSADAAQDTVILSVQDLAAAQQAVDLARQDQEDEHGTGGAAGAGDRPGHGAGSAGHGIPGPRRPPGGPPAGGSAPGSTPAGRQQPGGPAAAAPAGAGPGGLARRGPVPGGARRPPPWGTVLVTTVRLWAQRRRHLRWPAQARWRVLSVLVLAAVLFAAGAISIALAGSPAPPARTRASPAGTGRAPAPAAIRAAAAARTAAAGWIAAQVSAAAIVSCAPQMCALLEARGVPAAQLLPLGGSNPAPLGSDLIVSTAAVRSEFGARLGSVYAPVVLASFGTGSAQTAVRVVAADGAAAYMRSLGTDVAARASAGSQLLQNPRLHSSASARRALAAGQVDSRLLTAFAALATMHVVDVVGFPAPATGASAGMPLRIVDIAPGRPGTPRRPNTIGALASYLRAQLFPYRPAHITVVRLASGRPALRVEYGAPSPLGLLGKG
jgi:hypothetical protein